MIVLGIILLLIGYFTGLSILYTIGGILVVVGLVLWILGAVGRRSGGDEKKSGSSAASRRLRTARNPETLNDF